jgi:hypothetical protein
VFNIVPMAGVVERLEADIVRLDTAEPPSAKVRPVHVPAKRAAGE